MPTIRMSPATRLFLAGNTVSMLGTGLVIAFILIYLHQVRGVALPVVGGLLTASAGAGLLVVPLVGILLDRIGARRVLTGIVVGQAAAQVLLAWAHNAATALPVLLLYGATWAPMFPAIRTMIAGLNPEPETQQRAFAINFTTQNAAIGLGTTVGAIVANVHHPGTFQALFLANAASCLLFAVTLPFLPSLHRPRGADEPRVGYRDVLASRALRLILVASLLICFTGPPAFDSGLPAYSTVEAHMSAHIVALSIPPLSSPRSCSCFGSSAGSGAATRWCWSALYGPCRGRYSGWPRCRSRWRAGSPACSCSPQCSDSAKPSWRRPWHRSSTPWPTTGSAAGLTRLPRSPSRWHSPFRL